MPVNDAQHEDAAQFGRLENARMLQDALQCIHSSSEKTQDVEVSGSSRGLCFSVCTPGSLLASVVIPARAFSEFRSNTSRVRVNLSLLVDCLATATADRPAAARLTVSPDVLRLTLIEEDCRTESALRTVEGEGTLLHAFRDEGARHPAMASAILSSETLRDAITELDYGGADCACLRVATHVPRFVMAAPPGRRPAVQVQFADPLDPAQDTFDEFKCENTVVATYRLSLLQRTMKALGASDKSKIKVNENGSLSIVCKMKSSHGAALDRCFVEFLILAQELDENDEDEEQGVGVQDEEENMHNGDEDDYEAGFW